MAVYEGWVNVCWRLSGEQGKSGSKERKGSPHHPSQLAEGVPLDEADDCIVLRDGTKVFREIHQLLRVGSQHPEDGCLGPRAKRSRLDPSDDLAPGGRVGAAVRGAKEDDTLGAVGNVREVCMLVARNSEGLLGGQSGFRGSAETGQSRTCLMMMPPKLWPTKTSGRRSVPSPSRLLRRNVSSCRALSRIPATEVLPTTLALYPKVMARVRGRL